MRNYALWITIIVAALIAASAWDWSPKPANWIAPNPEAAEKFRDNAAVRDYESRQYRGPSIEQAIVATGGSVEQSLDVEDR
jgi:hypothetical protein